MGEGVTSLIEDYGSSNQRCGYCSSSSGFISHGMMARKLTVYDYQDLIDGGWRRSGCYVYKPDPVQMCCPAFTIRLNAGEFVPSKSQKKVLRRLGRHLTGMHETPPVAKKKTLPKNAHVKDMACSKLDHSLLECYKLVLSENNWPVVSMIFFCIWCYELFLKARMSWCAFFFLSKVFDAQRQFSSGSVHPLTKKEANAAPKGTLYVSNFLFPLFAFLKRSCTANIPNSPSDLAQMFAEKLNQTLEEFNVENTLGHLNFLPKASEGASDEFFEEDANHPEAEGTSMCSVSDEEEEVNATRNDVEGHKLEIQLIRSTMIEEEYQLYKKYQVAIHKDRESSCSRSQYKNFLIASPFPYVSRSEDPEAPESGYGAFHMQYRIDGKLIAVGVVDILPRCLSSKYLFWDPDCASLALGKVTALKEIEWVRQVALSSPNLKYYYMGYYIHSCPKMAYKGDYSPSEVLCPDTYRWVRLTKEMKSELETHKVHNLVNLSNNPTKDNQGYSKDEKNNSIEDQLVSIYKQKLIWATAKGLLSEYSIDLRLIERMIERWRELTGYVGKRITYQLSIDHFSLF